MVSTKLAGKSPWRPSLLQPLHHALSIVSTSLMMSPGSKDSSVSSSVGKRGFKGLFTPKNKHVWIIYSPLAIQGVYDFNLSTEENLKESYNASYTLNIL